MRAHTYTYTHTHTHTESSSLHARPVWCLRCVTGGLENICLMTEGGNAEWNGGCRFADASAGVCVCVAAAAELVDC